MDSSATCTRRRSSAATARSIGCACRASISDACFAALLGTRDNDHWRIAPADGPGVGRQTYRPNTLVLETEFETESGVVRVSDCMPPDDVVRVVEGIRGEVEMAMELVIRFDYGLTIPWVHVGDGGLKALAGPNALRLRCDVPTQGEELATCARFTVSAGERKPARRKWTDYRLEKARSCRAPFGW